MSFGLLRPDSGEFRWLKRVRYATKVGDVAGCLNNVTGYWHVRIGHRNHPAHQLAWLYMTGDWCRPMIDHRDTNRANNRWDNLRRATKSTNAANRVRQRNNSSGFKGVSLDRKSGRWRSQTRAHALSRPVLDPAGRPRGLHGGGTKAVRRICPGGGRGAVGPGHPLEPLPHHCLDAAANGALGEPPPRPSDGRVLFNELLTVARDDP
jgi:hypothetical protein